MDFVLEVIEEGKDFIVIRGCATDDKVSYCPEVHLYDLGQVVVPPGVNVHLVRVCHITTMNYSVVEIGATVLDYEPNLLWAYIYAGN